MKNHEFTNKTLSFFFRFILISFGLLLVYSNNNKFPSYYYLLAIIPYLLIYFKTLFREGYFSKIRLLNDYALIIFILLGKDIGYSTICYLMLPIINSPNHSGQKKSIWLYLLFVTSLYVLNNFQFSASFIYVTIVLFLINLITDSRKRFYDNITKLNKEIERFIDENIEVKKSYKVYNGLVQMLNNLHFLLFYTPIFEDIICFTNNGQSIYLENSSSFIWSYHIDKKCLDDESEQCDIDLTIDGKRKNKNFIIKNQTAYNDYIYIFILKDLSIPFFNLYYIQLLKPVIARLSRMFDLEKSIKKENKKILRVFRDKYFHIKNAEKAMHFIRNRFNTLDNFIEMSKDNIEGVMDSEDLQMYDTELTRLDRNYKLLLERVDSILSKPDKPFSATKRQSVSPNILYGYVREVWLDYHSEFNPELNWDLSNTSTYKIAINTEGLYILLTDWITNITKFSNGDSKVVFNETNNNIEVIFKNYCDSINNDLIDLVEDFNSTERDRILKRTSHGISIMKSIIEEMGLTGKMSIENNYLSLKLTFKKSSNENSNI